MGHIARNLNRAKGLPAAANAAWTRLKDGCTPVKTDEGFLDDLAQKLGKLIEVERKRVKLTQEDVAARLGVSQNAVTGWERAIRHGSLHLSTILALEDLFALPRGVFLQRMGLMSDYPDFEAVVLANMKLNEEQKDALVRLYRVMVNRNGD